MLRMLKKLLFPGVTDKKVDKINAESTAMLHDATEMSKRHSTLLKKNGVALLIYIGSGGDNHGR